MNLTLKAAITTAANDNLFFFYFSEKKSLDISYESSAKQLADNSHKMTTDFREKLKF